MSIGCSSADLSTFEGPWKIDLLATQASLHDTRYMIPQTKAAAQLSSALLKRHRFKFHENTLRFGVAKNEREITLEYRRTENKTRQVYRVSDSLHLFRITKTSSGATIDFEGKTWYLVRDES
jgi:hypothetical protein